MDLGSVVLALWFLGALAVSVGVYHQLPHILDAVSYTFQAGILGSGRWWLALPPLEGAFRGPFQVVDQGAGFRSTRLARPRRTRWVGWSG